MVASTQFIGSYSPLTQRCNPKQLTAQARPLYYRWTEEHRDIAESVASHVSCHYGPMAIEESAGFLRLAKPSSQSIAVFIAGTRRDTDVTALFTPPKWSGSLQDQAQSATVKSIARDQDHAYTNCFLFPSRVPKPLSPKEIGHMELIPSMSPDDLDALELQAKDEMKEFNLTERRALARAEMQALYQRATRIKRGPKGSKIDLLRRERWKEYFTRQEQLRSAGLLAEERSTKFLSHYADLGIHFFPTQRQARHFCQLWSRYAHTGSFVTLSQHPDGDYAVFIGKVPKDPETEVERWRILPTGVDVQASPYRRGDRTNAYHICAQIAPEHATQKLARELNIDPIIEDRFDSTEPINEWIHLKTGGAFIILREDPKGKPFRFNTTAAAEHFLSKNYPQLTEVHANLDSSAFERYEDDEGTYDDDDPFGDGDSGNKEDARDYRALQYNLLS